MGKLGIGLPSLHFVVSLLIALAILSLIAGAVPENIKKYFRI